jgi:hypothetical protein
LAAAAYRFQHHSCQRSHDTPAAALAADWALPRQDGFIGPTSGCIRMINEDIIDLFGRASLGASVIVT